MRNIKFNDLVRIQDNTDTVILNRITYLTAMELGLVKHGEDLLASPSEIHTKMMLELGLLKEELKEARS